ncbi:MAG TPA: hypothetical protein VEH27_11130 [Methylomirabilota bacterium]|nr:hypothetical protein [Methylomirabilota bacterium]
MPKQLAKPSKEALAGLKALRAAARQARKVAKVYGTPIYIERNGKVVAVKP